MPFDALVFIAGSITLLTSTVAAIAGIAGYTKGYKTGARDTIRELKQTAEFAEGAYTAAQQQAAGQRAYPYHGNDTLTAARQAAEQRAPYDN